MSQEAPIIGRTLAGKFRVTGVIGEGGMATVYRAQQDAEPHDVAVKVMNPELAKDGRFVRRFRREAKAASMLKHPNTVEIIEFGVDQGFVFLAMECLEGNDLALLLHRERRVTEARAASIVMQVCEALSAAHELSIVHRDLKPDNIMIVKQKGTDIEHVKVLDFGIAKILDDDGTKPPGDPRVDPITSAKSMLTRVGTIVGTPAYMAPEQGRAEPVDGRTDLYACGVLLYELVTGRVPFSGETPMQVVMRHVNEAPQPPSTFLPVDHALEAVIMRALSKFPAERQQNATELADALAELLPKLSTEKRQPGDSSGARVIIGDPPKAPAAAPIAAPPPTRPVARPAPQPAQKPAAAPPIEDSTLVLDPPDAPMAAAAPRAQPVPGRAAPQPAAPAASKAASSAPAFPTLNIDVPEDILDGIQPKAGAPIAAGKPAAPAPDPIDMDADSDDVRTLIAHEPPAGIEARVEAGVDVGDDDPRTVVAPPRGASIPDLSVPLAFSGGMGAGNSVAALRSRIAQNAATQANAPPQAQQKQADRDDRTTTLVSAAPDAAPATAAKSSGPKPPGTTALGALKGTAKLDPASVKVSVSSPSTVVPTTQPSQVVDLALAATQRIDNVQAAVAATLLERNSAPPQEPKPVEATALAAAPKAAIEEAAAPLVLDAPAGAAPAAKIEAAAAVVWEPQRRKLNGPLAMALGILIGALLFGFVLLILKMAH